MKVTTDYDKAANFQQYKTFTINQVDEKSQSISQLNKDRIVNSVKAEMTKKGFQENADPDLLVQIVTILQDKKSVTAARTDRMDGAELVWVIVIPLIT